MAICCVVCGEWYPTYDCDRLDICPDCFAANFSGAQPPLDWSPATARVALEAYVDSSHQMTPRQVEACARLIARWRREAAETP